MIVKLVVSSLCCVTGILAHITFSMEIGWDSLTVNFLKIFHYKHSHLSSIKLRLHDAARLPWVDGAIKFLISKQETSDLLTCTWMGLLQCLTNSQAK